MKTLLEIFQHEPDDAEIRCGSLPWQKVSYHKNGATWSWAALNQPIWQVKRKPRVFNAVELRGEIYPNHWDDDNAKPIKLMEVLDE